MTTRHRKPAAIRTVGALAVAFSILASGTRGIPDATAGSIAAKPTAKETCSAQGQVGTVGRVTGGVRIKHGRETKSARKGTRVYKGDVVSTRSKQKASVAMCGGGHIYLNEKSAAAIHSRDDVQAKKGEVADKTSSKSAQRLRTKDAEARGRGTYVDAQAQRGRSVFIVARGTAEVKNKHGRVQVTRDHKTSVVSNRAPVAPTSVDSQKVLAWTAPLTETWHILTATGVVNGPQRLVLDSQGNIYVTDIGISDHRVVKLSASGKTITTWHLTGGAPVPSGIAIDRQNNLYVTDDNGATVQKFTLSGQPIATFSLQHYFPANPIALSGIELDGAGNMYVTDEDQGKVLKLGPDGQLLASWGSDGSGRGQFNFPADLALDAQGNIYVADHFNNRVQKLSPTGQVLAVWNLGVNSSPADVTLDARGNIYVTTSSPEGIHELAPDGHQVQIWQNDPLKNLTDPGEFDRPYGVALDAKNNIYVADHYGGRIQKLTRG